MGQSSSFVSSMFGTSRAHTTGATDLEKTTAWKHAGYPAFSAFAASSKDCFAIRRFAELNVRILLKLQNDIVSMERRLHDMDEYTRKLPDPQGGCGSFRLDEETPRQALLDDLADAVHEYNVRLKSFMDVSDRPTAAPEQIHNLQNWLANRPHAIEEAEQEFLIHGNDMLSIRAPQRTHLGRWMESLGLWRFARAPIATGSGVKTKYYDRNQVKALGGFLFLFTTLVLLIAPLWTLTFVEAGTTSLLLVTAFTIAFAFLLLAGTTLKPFYRSISTAGYFAIAVLILGLSPPWDSPSAIASAPSPSPYTTVVRTTTMTETTVSISTATSVASVSTVTRILSESDSSSQSRSAITPAVSATSATFQTNSQNGFSSGAIAGIVLGSLTGGLAIAATIGLCYRSTSRRLRSTAIETKASVSRPSPEDETDSIYPTSPLWKADDYSSRKYTAYVKELSDSIPYLAYLSHWMETGVAPSAQKDISHSRKQTHERMNRMKVCLINYRLDAPTKVDQITHADNLRDALDADGSDKLDARLIVVEDLSPSVVEVLGSHFDVDPRFFCSQISVRMTHHSDEASMQPLGLNLNFQSRSHFALTYMRARNFPHEGLEEKTQREIEEAEQEIKNFNVVRNMESQLEPRSGYKLFDKAGVRLTRSKTSLWLRPADHAGPAVAILLVDPTLSAGHPLWGGYTQCADVPLLSEFEAQVRSYGQKPAQLLRPSLFDEIIAQSQRASNEDIRQFRAKPIYIGFSMFRLVVEDWLIVLRYMESQLNLIHWGLNKPKSTPRDDLKHLERLLLVLTQWSWNIDHSQRMIDESMANLYQEAALPQTEEPGKLRQTTSERPYLLADYQHLAKLLSDGKARTARLESRTLSAISYTQQRLSAGTIQSAVYRAVTLLAIFLPAILISTFLSMTYVFWLFFAVAVPFIVMVTLVEWISRHRTAAAFEDLFIALVDRIGKR